MNSMIPSVSLDTADIARRFEQVAQSIPLDVTARLVASKGFHYDPSVRSVTLRDLWFDDCPEFVRLPRYPFRNLKGVCNGNLTCVGYFGSGIWVMRCVCGRFKLKRAQRITHPTNPNVECCIICRRAEHMRDSSRPSDFTRTNDINLEATKSSQIVRVPIFNRFYKKEPIPPEIRWAVWERDNFTCKHCESRQNLSVDHILAESKGGTMTLENLQTLCKSCNSRKGDR